MKKNNRCYLNNTIVACAIVLLGVNLTYSQQLTTSSPEEIYGDVSQFDGVANHKLFIDASPFTLKRNSTQMNFYMSNASGLDKYYGTLEQPFGTVSSQNHDTSVNTYSGLWTNPPVRSQVRFIANAYKITSTTGMPAGVNVGDLLGFVHIERGANEPWNNNNWCDFYTECTYTIGLAYSPASLGANCGLKWTYLGDIIQPYKLKGPANTTNGICHDTGNHPGHCLHNIGGIPYVVNKTKDSLYVYFNEFFDSTTVSPTIANGTKGIGVARARIYDILQYAVASTPTVGNWQKWTGSGWTTNALSGSGPAANVVPLTSNLYNDYDAHADAAYCKTLNKYLLTMNSGGKILISSSQNGIVWTRPRQVTNTNANDFYSCFASLDADAADDCHEVGRSFSIYFKRTISTTVDTVDALYRVKVKCSNINGELKTLLLE